MIAGEQDSSQFRGIKTILTNTPQPIDVPSATKKQQKAESQRPSRSGHNEDLADDVEHFGCCAGNKNTAVKKEHAQFYRAVSDCTDEEEDKFELMTRELDYSACP